MDNPAIVAEIRRIIGVYFDYARAACDNSDPERAIGHIEDGIAALRKLTDALE
ncbi:MAG: hypothetical protein JNM20_00790 [Rhizobiales bacterium]|nr:hypothetical protein [Hyphomicrobiales bacterium]